MAGIDIDALKTDILGKLTALVEGDINDHVAFAERQTRGIAKQAAWIAATALVPFGKDGGFDDREEMDWFVENLEEISRNFVKTVVGLTVITLEKAWNAVVATLWDAINAVIEPAIGIALPIPGARI